MNGPAAPKNPEKKRDFFYIIKNKDIFGTKTDEGKGIQYLYQDDGRLENSARITGGITKLVHSIGVSAETEDPSENILFIFQMYGRNDIYGGGTELTLSLNGDSIEKRIYLSEAAWREDDFKPGQIKVIMEKPGQIAKLNVKLYLNDGYSAPEVSEEKEIDFNCCFFNICRGYCKAQTCSRACKKREGYLHCVYRRVNNTGCRRCPG